MKWVLEENCESANIITKRFLWVIKYPRQLPRALKYSGEYFGLSFKFQRFLFCRENRVSQVTFFNETLFILKKKKNQPVSIFIQAYLKRHLWLNQERRNEGCPVFYLSGHKWNYNETNSGNGSHSFFCKYKPQRKGILVCRKEQIIGVETGDRMDARCCR